MSQVLGLREVHKAGATRLCTDGGRVLTGGADGVVALFRRKGWPSSSAVWARQCHESAVTCAVLCDALQLALTCGRDGRVLLHENIDMPPPLVVSGDAEAVASAQPPGLSTRAVCKLTGEVRCLSFDATHKRIFIGGDSLRCLEMNGTKFDVITYSLRVPYPIVALALSPCHAYLAMGSGPSGAVHIRSTHHHHPSRINGDSDGAAPMMDVVLPGMLAPSYKRDEDVVCRLDWCRTAGGLFLLIPCVNEVRVFSVSETGAGDATAMTAKQVAVLHGEESGLVEYTSVTSYPVSAHRFVCVMASRRGVFVAKVDDRRFAMTRYNAQYYPSTTSVTDVCVQKKTGDVVVALSDGHVSLLAKLAPKEGSIVGTPVKTAVAAAGTLVSAGVTSTTTAAVVNEEETHNDGSSGEDDSGSDSSSESSRRSSDDEEDADVEDEDLPKVVADLRRANADFMTDGEDGQRPSRWRDEDPRHVLRETERRRPASSRFLDDEADERSSESASSSYSAAAADGDGGEEDDAEDARYSGEEDEERDCARRAHDRKQSTEMMTYASNDYAFQVGATPVGEEGSCYLAYNSVGYIHTARDATTVHFHDISQPAVRILERGTLLMGTLSPVGAGFVVASPNAADAPHSVDDDAVDENGDGRARTDFGAAGHTPRLTIYYRTFVALGAQADWRVRLQPGETVRCLAAGLHFLAVATSRYLRLFSLSGVELAVLSKYNRIVTMVGTTSAKLMGAYKAELDPLAIVYMLGTGEHYVEVLDIGARRTLIAAHPMPLTTSSLDGPHLSSTGASTSRMPSTYDHQLQWLGWSEDGPLHAVDTAGVVRMYTESWGGAWVPVYDPRAALDQSDNLWVWGVNDESLLAYRASKNDPPYPAALATGLPATHVSLFLPLTGGTSGSALHGGLVRDRDTITVDHLLRRQIRADELKLHGAFYTAAMAKHDALHDKTIMELFTSALKAQQTTRAMDLATMLELRDNVETCARTANAQGHGQLARKLLALCQLRSKTKSKRRCQLPLEGSLVSEKERDLILRKLLAKEKDKDKTTPSGDRTHEPTTTSAATVSTAPPPTEEVEETVAVVSDPAPVAPTPRRRVTFFDAPVAASKPMATAATTLAPTAASTATTTTATTTKTKAVNPFAKPAATSATAASAPRTPERSTQPRMTATTPTPSPASPSPVKSPAAAAATSGREEVDGGRGSAGGALATHDAPRRSTFVAKALPVPVKASARSVDSHRGNSRDPFLTPEDETVLVDEHSSASTLGSSVMTVETLLTQRGPEDDGTLNPQTARFGEALRKRYRDDEDEDDVTHGAQVLGQVDLLARTLMPRVEHL